MINQSDFGYADVKWEEMNAENAKLVEAEYRQRFDASIKGWDDIDKKGQYVLSGIIGLITAVVGLSFTQAKNIDSQYLIGLFVLAIALIIAAAFVAWSLYPRPYINPGFTPSDLNVSKWLRLLSGDEKSAIRLCGVRIKELARAIHINETSNAAKSTWLRNAIIATVAAFPAALVSVAVAAGILRLAKVSGTAVAAPIHVPVGLPGAAAAPPILIGVVAALLLGLAAGILLGRRILPARHVKPLSPLNN
jgi:hypothetical protein